jgi:enoyl-CoA hydratase/carnithine racemase
MEAHEYECLSLDVAGDVATLTMHPLSRFPEGRGPVTEIHTELAHALTWLRFEDSVRVVVVTGEGDEFLVTNPTERWAAAAEALVGSDRARRVFDGIVRVHQALVESEKPIVARVNGDAIGFGQSIVLGCDLIVAAEDAILCDMHMGVGDVRDGRGRAVGPPFALVPGDGGAVLAPMYFSPPLAKEYLMLARPYRARELARQGLINYAVARESLDAKVDELVAELLKRPADALAWTKRVANRLVAAQMNQTLDAAAAYELVNMMHRRPPAEP